MRQPPPAVAKTRGHILIDDVVKIYDPDGAAVMAVDHCSLEIEAGEICMIVSFIPSQPLKIYGDTSTLAGLEEGGIRAGADGHDLCGV